MCVNKPIIITWRDKQFEDFLFRMNSIMTQNKTRLVLKLFGVLVLKMAAFVRFVDNRGRYSTLKGLQEWPNITTENMAELRPYNYLQADCPDLLAHPDATNKRQKN